MAISIQLARPIASPKMLIVEKRIFFLKFLMAILK
jgi:hypothetical protein